MTDFYQLFTEEEVRCKCGCGLILFHPGFKERLLTVRLELNKGMTPTSTCRCAAHNEREGGHPRSLHVGDKPAHADKGQLGCMAIDIWTPNGNYRGSLFNIAWKHGFSIGWNAKKSFLHLDLRILIGMEQTSFDY